MLSEAVASEAGKVLLPYVLEKVAAQNNSTIKNTQAGQAGAVPSPDTAPMTGAPHEVDHIVETDQMVQQNDRTATNYSAHNAASLANVAKQGMSYLHGSNGTSYDNDNR